MRPEQPIVTFGIDRARPGSSDKTIIQKCTLHNGVAVCQSATVEDMAKVYVDTLSGPPDDWGQYVHRTFGPSYEIMLLMAEVFGNEKAQKAISAELASRKIRKHDNADQA